MGENIFVLSMLLYSMPYSMARSKSLQNLLKSGKHPQILRITKPSVCRSVVVVTLNTSFHHFFPKLSCMRYDLLKINIFLVSKCTTFVHNIRSYI